MVLLIIWCLAPLLVITVGLGMTLVAFYELFIFLSSRPPPGLRRVPGPKGYPLVGNIGQLSIRPQRELKQWAREYGELFQLRLGLTNWIYVNNVPATRDIFDKQSRHTSSRLPRPVANDIIGGDMRFVLMADNPKWGFLRGITHRFLTPSKSMTYQNNQELEAKQLAYDLLVDNVNQNEFYKHTQRFATSVIMTTTYGWRLPTSDCEDINVLYNILHELSDSMVPGAYLADVMPFLARLPEGLQWWRQNALKNLDYQNMVWMKYWERLKKGVYDGLAPESFGRQLVEDPQGLTELECAFLAGSMLEAGAETTSTTINSCLRYLAMNPEVQDRAHEELDRVVGYDRAPDWSDQENLPYIDACHRETSRLRPPSNDGVLHYTTKDIEYNGYHIAKDTVVAMNQYAMYYDPIRYPKPEQFVPDRFLQSVKVDDEKKELPDRWVFGAGRRLCPGMHFAVNSMYIALARILWAYDIRKPLDESGCEMDLDVSDFAYEDGRFTVPKQYKVRFIPRSPEHETVVRNDWELARDGL